MDEKIRARIAALHAAAEHHQQQLVAIRTVLAELTALLQPDAPTMSGDPLDERPDPEVAHAA